VKNLDVTLAKVAVIVLTPAASQIQCKLLFLIGAQKMPCAKPLTQHVALLKAMLMNGAANTKVRAAGVLVVIVAAVKVVLEAHRAKMAELVVLVIVVMRIVKLACTTAVHLVQVWAVINLVQVKNLAKKVPVKVVLEVHRVKIEALVVNLVPNMAKNLQKAN
jgi:hypothetical protein